MIGDSGRMARLPLIAPRPPHPDAIAEAVARIARSGSFSNNGPELRAFEAEATETLFAGRGACLAVANATLGLMLAIRAAAGEDRRAGRYALMPALTFAATGQAADWAGLQPLIADVDPDDWSLSAAEEERLLRAEPGRIAVIVPYATFGAAIDLDRYRWLAERHGVGIVVDAAASIGTLDEGGIGFGAGAPFAIVHSMQATKPFAVAEGGLIHSGDVALIARLRAMAGFGFGAARSATMPGLNAKLPEVIAAMARLKLAELDTVSTHRAALADIYRQVLPADAFQRVRGRRQAMAFQPVLLPRALAADRDPIMARLEAEGIGCGRYFSPHLGQQPWFRRIARIEPTPVADAIAARLVSLPITDAMTAADARRVATAFARACDGARRRLPARAMARTAPAIAPVMLIGGGPAGMALLAAASRRGRLRDLARGMIVVDRGPAPGAGTIGRYAVTGDSTAATFLSIVAGHPDPAMAALSDGAAAQAVARFADAPGVPLATVTPLLAAAGETLATLVERDGGTLMTRHEALGATRTPDGLWRVRLRRLPDGEERECLTRQLVLATGGHQPLDRLVAQQVAGAPLLDLAGGRLVQSDMVLGETGIATVADLLAGRRAPRVAIVGGSTSALAVATLLLRSDLPLGAGAVTLLHRRPLRPFYPSVAAAQADGFTDFGPDDVCPVSRFVYRLAGFRLESRELLLRMLAVGGRTPDPRLALHAIAGDDAAARDHIRRADLVVAALGYRPRALPLAGFDGRPLALAADRGAAMVDRDSRILAASGRPIAGLWGIGLAAGFVPSGALGGEPSFRGQANGLWLWQNDVGAAIVDQLLDRSARAAA